MPALEHSFIFSVRSPRLCVGRLLVRPLMKRASNEKVLLRMMTSLCDAATDWCEDTEAEVFARMCEAQWPSAERRVYRSLCRAQRKMYSVAFVPPHPSFSPYDFPLVPAGLSFGRIHNDRCELSGLVRSVCFARLCSSNLQQMSPHVINEVMKSLGF
jgi:hypothetical protein